MKKLKTYRNLVVTAVLMLALGIFIGWLIKPTEAHAPAAQQTATGAIWTCSMDPQVRQPEPGKCPLCGMDLIPLFSDDGEDSDPLEIAMSPTAIKLADIRTAVVDYVTPVKEIRLNGKVQPDERLRFSQVAHIEGRVEALAVNFTGEPVRKGQQIASVYSPELVTAQEELFAAQKIKDMQPVLFQAAKQKLKNWKLTDAQIEQILAVGKPQTSFPILADVSGIVSEKKVNLGDYVMRGMVLYEIVDLSRVWILFDAYEGDIRWVGPGSTVEFTVQSLPGESFTGKVVFIDPAINPATRVATARVEVHNPGGKLKPEMFAAGVLKTQLPGKTKHLAVPKSAVLWTGERSVVYLKTSDGAGIRFRMQEVTLGPLTSEGYVVKEGLSAGDVVAVNGTFSIDAAAQLAGKPSMMNPEGTALATSQHHHGTNAFLPSSVEVSTQAKEAVKKLFDLYFPLKDALVKEDFASAKKHAADLVNTFEKTSMDLFTGPSQERWMNYSRAAAAALAKINTAKDIADARIHFKPLSGQMVNLAQAFGPFAQTVYVQHCPMADNNTGADWLSLDKEIQNPYFGDKMLKCGKVMQTIQ